MTAQVEKELVLRAGSKLSYVGSTGSSRRSSSKLVSRPNPISIHSRRHLLRSRTFPMVEAKCRKQRDACTGRPPDPSQANPPSTQWRAREPVSIPLWQAN
jgi:hypothetical protein